MSGSMANNEPVKFICPSIDELSVIINQVRCEKCNLEFSNESRYRMHDVKVHGNINLNKHHKENVRYNCPIKNCIYAPNRERSFTLYKYVKQVSTY